ncbi:MAG: HAD-IA family hydrolase [Candidatus Woesearchaeota archaeon]|jgi:phosphoglycolate phosphatase-like HAD superfamily hydrolase|nr:HAD-IA family hydrolase [Candidatus Woesearchaeota archaeon]MDP7506704.1 HAD-IA family hydrolase [Candidatus Woesearchaeota archaeon]|tara:strand:- start:627 stop:1250 length:624 start_codon:yes stop_codon:yes gene_type:complete
MIKAVIFDLDGTLVDSLPLIIELANRFSEKFGYKKIENIPALRNKGIGEIIKDLGLPIYKLPLLIKKMRRKAKDKLKDVKIFEGIKSVIERLSKKYAIGILTTNSKKYVKYMLRREKITCVKFVFSSSSLFGKDIVLRKILKKRGLKNDEIVYVGDELRDIRACKRVGVKVIAVSWGFNSKSLLMKGNPDFIAEKPEDILSIVKGIK